MKFFAVLLSLSLVTGLFQPQAVEVMPAADANLPSNYITNITKLIGMRYAVDFSKMQVKRLNKNQAQAWVKRAAQKKTLKMNRANARVLEAVGDHPRTTFVLLSNLRNPKFNSILVVGIPLSKIGQINASDYIITNASKDEDDEDTDVCTNTWGYELDLTGINPGDIEGAEGELDRCPCMQESVEEDDCEDSGACADPC